MNNFPLTISFSSLLNLFEFPTNSINIPTNLINIPTNPSIIIIESLNILLVGNLSNSIHLIKNGNSGNPQNITPLNVTPLNSGNIPLNIIPLNSGNIPLNQFHSNQFHSNQIVNCHVILLNNHIVDKFTSQQDKVSIHLFNWLFNSPPWIHSVELSINSLQLSINSLQLSINSSISPPFLKSHSLGFDWSVLYPFKSFDRNNLNFISFYIQKIKLISFQNIQNSLIWNNYTIQFINPPLKKTITHVPGYNDILNSLSSHLSTFLNPHSFKKYQNLNLQVPKSILLSSPSKLLSKNLVDALSKSMAIPFLTLNLTNIIIKLNHLIHQDIPNITSSHLIDLFENITQLNYPIILFIQDGDVFSIDEFKKQSEIILDIFNSSLPSSIFLITHCFDSKNIKSFKQFVDVIVNVPQLNFDKRWEIIGKDVKVFSNVSYDTISILSSLKNTLNDKSLENIVNILPDSTNGDNDFEILIKEPIIIKNHPLLERLKTLIINPILHPEKFHKLGMNTPKGLLLYGENGIGKYELIQWITSSSPVKINVINVNPSNVFDKYLGKSEENLRNYFKLARNVQPSLIFFPDISTFASKRIDDDTISKRILTTLLTEMDGIEDSNVYVIGICNIIDELDDAIKRPGRFDFIVHVDKPSFQQRFDIILELNRGNGDLEWKDKVELMNGWSSKEVELWYRIYRISLLKYDRDTSFDKASKHVTSLRNYST